MRGVCRSRLRVLRDLRGKLRRLSDAFENRRDPLSAADALSCERIPLALAMQNLRSFARDARASRPERMAERNRSAIEVDQAASYLVYMTAIIKSTPRRGTRY